MEKRKIIILGSGCSGLTAAIYTARANLKPLVIEGNTPGGQLTYTSEIENFPGFENGISGFELLENMKKQSQRFGAEFVTDHITKIEIDEEETKKQKNIQNPSDFPILKLHSQSGKIYVAESVIVATGASARFLGVPGEQELYGKGVTSCATCDGFFYKGKEVAVIGGGDSACEEATFLTRFASKIHLIHRRDTLRASKYMQKKLFSMKDQIIPVWNTVVEKVVGEGDKFKGLQIKDTKTGKSKLLNVSGMFLAIGHKPSTEFLKDFVDLDPKGYVVPLEGSQVKTKVPSLFASGDCVDHTYRQAITSSGLGCMAGLEAERFLSKKE